MLPYFRKCIINTFSIDYHLWQATKPSARTLCYLAVKPQVTFASLSSPAVMDIRRLLALASDKVERGDARLR